MPSHISHTVVQFLQPQSLVPSLKPCAKRPGKTGSGYQPVGDKCVTWGRVGVGVPEDRGAQSSPRPEPGHSVCLSQAQGGRWKEVRTEQGAQRTDSARAAGSTRLHGRCKALALLSGGFGGQSALGWNPFYTVPQRVM
jgi:hypothetical protein